MFQHALKMLVLSVATVVAAGVLAADVSVSKSNNAQAVLGPELAQLLDQEKAALGTINPQQVNRLARTPQRWFLLRRTPAFPFTREYLDSLPVAKGDAQWKCLAEALYFEARGESIKGQFAVAEVILNRVESSRFPDTVCKVVHQGTGRRYKCQFTYMCDGRAERVTDQAAWKTAGKIARIMLNGQGPESLTDGATHYHTLAVRPRWSRVFLKTATIGEHQFYRMTSKTASNG